MTGDDGGLDIKKVCTYVYVCVRARVRAPVCVDIPGEVLGVGKIKGKMGKLSHWVAG